MKKLSLMLTLLSIVVMSTVAQLKPEYAKPDFNANIYSFYTGFDYVYSIQTFGECKYMIIMTGNVVKPGAVTVINLTNDQRQKQKLELEIENLKLENIILKDKAANITRNRIRNKEIQDNYQSTDRWNTQQY